MHPKMNKTATSNINFILKFTKQTYIHTVIFYCNKHYNVLYKLLVKYVAQKALL